MNNKVCTFAAIAAVLVLQGCAPITPRADKMVASSQNIATTAALGLLQRNVAYSGTGAVGEALQKTLSEAKLLQPAIDDARFKLTAELQRLDEPSFAINMTITAVVRYVLTEQATSRTVFDRTVTTEFTAGFGDAMLGLQRQKLAREGAFRANIAELIAYLGQLSPTYLAKTEPAASPPIAQAPATVAATSLPEKRELVAESNATAIPTIVNSKDNPPSGTSKTESTQPQVTPKQNLNLATGESVDERAPEMKKTYDALRQQARSGKVSYLSAARRYKEKFEGLYPEQAGNPWMNEYLAYMVVVGEKVDKKKLTEAEGEYELARKVSELQERANAMQAIANSQQDAAARKANEEAEKSASKARQEETERRVKDEAAARLSAEEQRLALQREIAARQLAAAEAERRAQSSAAWMALGLQLLTPPPVPRTQTCIGRFVGPNYIQSCN